MSSRAFLTTIALWEIVGGMLGAIGVLSLFGAIPNAAIAKTFFGCALALCVLSIGAGVMLLLRVPTGRSLSLVVQGVQLIQFSFGWCRFEVIAGPRFQVGLYKAGDRGPSSRQRHRYSSESVDGRSRTAR